MGLTVPPVGLGVTLSPPVVTVMRGEAATLTCHFNVLSKRYGVHWFRMDRPLTPSPRYVRLEKNHSSSLLITEAAPEDSGKYYCEVTVPLKDPVRSNGTLLTVLVSMWLSSLVTDAEIITSA
ncbi:hypothetical protein WMY93_031937 [Mugilogobius chulae]|uniref:Ig-like domain-containing protein n=1 Tax=Mugilogobius chulae TaxID=88201 RepID=A0AAW0MF04_9GOBI